MTPAEHLTKLIGEKVPRLQGWEIEGLVRHLMEAGYKLPSIGRCPYCGEEANSQACGAKHSSMGWTQLGARR